MDFFNGMFVFIEQLSHTSPPYSKSGRIQDVHSLNNELYLKEIYRAYSTNIPDIGVVLDCIVS